MKAARLIGMASVILVTTALVGCSDPSSTSPEASTGLTKVTVAENNTDKALYVVIADEQGMFEKYGLDVEIEIVTNMALLPAAIASNQYDFANIVAPLFLNAKLQNLPIIATAGSYLETASNPLFGLMVKDDSPIGSLDDLPGATIATPTIQGNISQCLLWDLKQNNIDPKAVTLTAVPFADMLGQLDAGLVDAMLMQAPQTTALTSQGYRMIVDPCLSIGEPQQTAFQMSNAEWAKSNPETIKAFQKAIAEAGEWAIANPEKAQKMLAKFTGMPESVTASYVPPQLVGTPPTNEDLANWAAALVELGALASVPDLSGASFTG